MAAIAVACSGSGGSHGDGSTTTTSERATAITGGGVPVVEVRAGRRRLALRPYTYCWQSVCADGAPSNDPESIGPTGAVTIVLPGPEWQLTVDFQAAGHRCAPMARSGVHVDARGRAQVRPPAVGAYDVSVFARREGAGDVAAQFRWTVAEGTATVPPVSTATFGAACVAPPSS